MSLLCWAPVTLACDGSPEPYAIHYIHEVALLPPQGFVPCVVDGVATTCPLPAPKSAFTPADDMDDGCVSILDPATGEVAMVRTTAVDEWGMEDCGA